MKKRTVNIITSILGYLVIGTIIPVVFIVESNLGIILPALLIIGIILIYFKNNDAKALLKNNLQKFIK
jgi:hypothetical protein